MTLTPQIKVRVRQEMLGQAARPSRQGGIELHLESDLRTGGTRLIVRRSTHLSSQGEVVQAGNAEDRMVDSFSFESAVAEDLPGLHAGEGVLDAGANLFVGAVVFLLSGWELFAVAAAVWNDQTGALIATVGNRHHHGVFAEPPPRLECSRRIAVTSSLKRRGLSPVKGAIQDGADAVITPDTP